MANINFICLALFAVIFGVSFATPLVGNNKCTWGPSYWCDNIKSAKGCGAVSHCIKAVWEKQAVPEDTDSICQICTDMVKQARDQLESNMTQEDLKTVFEESCKLIPLKIVAKECIVLADDFVPELIETLASQMNPQVVCSVAGLCNNAKIDEMLTHTEVAEKRQVLPGTCEGCNIVVTQMRKNFDDLSYTGFLEASLRACGKLGSYSDSCATAVFSNYEYIYTHLKENFNAKSVCHDAGACTEVFHQHKPEEQDLSTNVEITPMGNVGFVKAGDDVPCELCEQLVKHLRDILIANTTEAEFKRVMEGLCKQTGNFKAECLAVVDQYYPVLYDFLVNELNANAVCYMAGICQKGTNVQSGPIAPLVPLKTAELAVRVFKADKLVGKDEANSYKHQVNIDEKSQSNMEIVDPLFAQLPIERMSIVLPQGKELCTFCQYFLHFVQVQISDANTEISIKNTVEKACKMLPNSIEEQCDAFVEAYGNAVIALLVNEIDPAQVCPALTLCPKEMEVTNIEVLMNSGNGDKPNCPLCLFAVEQLETMLKNNKTQESIKSALETLCSHLPDRLKSECVDFVETYSKQLVEMLVADFTAQEVCVFLKLCKDNSPAVSSLNFVPKRLSQIDAFHAKKGLMADHNNFRKPFLPKEMLVDTAGDAQIATNEIPDNTYNGKPLIYADVRDDSLKLKASPQCVVCEFIMTQIDKELKDKSTDDQIKKIVHNVCSHLPKNMAKECNDFVDKYADLVIDLLTQELAPEDVCSTLSFCNGKAIELQDSIMKCAVCEEAIDVVEQILSNPNVDHNVEHIAEKACYALPLRYQAKCFKLMASYGENIIHLIATLADSGKVCTEIGMCGSGHMNFLQMVDETSDSDSKKEKELQGAKKCTWGPSYWCENEDQANECKALEHCQKNVWKASAPRVTRETKQLLGAKKCTWGPSYWCENLDQANECKALEHCRTNVWKANAPRMRRDAKELLGAKKCTWGPSYWCENLDQANECKALEHCRKNVWKANQPSA